MPYPGGRAPVQRVIYEAGFALWLAPLAFAVTFVLVWYLILLALERRRIVFRV